MFKWRDYQLEAPQKTYEWMQQNEGDPLIVLPTGSGKSLVISKICMDAMMYENQRVIVASTSQEIIEQNYKALIKIFPDANVGLYSAALGKKQHHPRIVIGTIGSLYKKANLINWRDLCIVDECHAISDNEGSMYRSFISALRRINPDMRVIGLSATPYRMKSGYLHKGEKALFGGISYELPLTQLIKEKYLVPLVNKASISHVNTDKFSLIAGEFSLKEQITAFDKSEMTKAAVEEILKYGHDRRCLLIFCVSIEHAKHIKNALLEKGVDTEMVCESTPPAERKRILEAQKTGKIRVITNVSVLTTGYDAPNIDMIVLLRATNSPGLFVQMCGRGMRLHPDKKDCLLLDLGQNLLRFGPLTHITVPDGIRRDKKRREGKMCPKCRTVNELRATECADCGYIFEGLPRTIKHALRASGAEPMSDEPHINAIPQWFDVVTVSYSVHQKAGSSDSLKCIYKTTAQWALEWVCFGHEKSFPREKAHSWWRERGGKLPAPQSAAEALNRIAEIGAVKTVAIKVKKEGKFDRILGYRIVKSDVSIVKETGNLTQMAVQSC